MLASLYRTFPALCFILILIGLSSCETDFDPNAPYKETTVIYGLIDPQDTVHYVKVNKAFLNTATNAMTIAATQPDSSYHYDSITVTMYELRKGPDSLVLHTFPMRPVRVSKEPGLFTYPDQIVYATGKAKMSEQSIAKIEVKNTRTGKITSAATALIPYFCIRQIGFFPPLSFQCTQGVKYPPLSVEIERRVQLTFALAENAAIYKGTYNIFVTEVTQDDSTQKMYSFPIMPDQEFVSSGQQTASQKAEPFVIAGFLDGAIDVSKDDNSTYRIADSVVAVVTAGTRDLFTYISVNNSFSAVTQTRPEFTNVKGGGNGLFTSRRIQKRSGYFPTTSIDTLNYLYPHLKFRNK